MDNNPILTVLAAARGALNAFLAAPRPVAVLVVLSLLASMSAAVLAILLLALVSKGGVAGSSGGVNRESFDYTLARAAGMGTIYGRLVIATTSLQAAAVAAGVIGLVMIFTSQSPTPILVATVATICTVHAAIAFTGDALAVAAIRRGTRLPAQRIRLLNTYIQRRMPKNKQVLLQLQHMPSNSVELALNIEKAITSAPIKSSAAEWAKTMLGINLHTHIADMGTRGPVADKAMLHVFAPANMLKRSYSPSDFLQSPSVIVDHSESMRSIIMRREGAGAITETIDEAVGLAGEWTSTINNMANDLQPSRATRAVVGGVIAMTVVQCAPALIAAMVLVHAGARKAIFDALRRTRDAVHGS